MEVGTAGENSFYTIHPKDHLKKGKRHIVKKKKPTTNIQQNHPHTKEDQVTKVPL